MNNSQTNIKQDHNYPVLIFDEYRLVTRVLNFYRSIAEL
jgi:hypothetical protein